MGNIGVVVGDEGMLVSSRVVGEEVVLGGVGLECWSGAVVGWAVKQFQLSHGISLPSSPQYEP